jgi:hypothetical protein
MGSDLVKNDVEVVLAEASGTKTYKITGSITGNDKANKVIMASNGSNLFVVTSKENGSFEIAVNTKGKYSVTCFGATEEIKTIDVTNDTNSLSDSFEVNKSAEGYGTVKGNIKFSSSFYSRYPTDQLTDRYEGPKMPNNGRYLVRLMGTGTTYYRTSAKADYICIDPSVNRHFTINETVATFSFDSVPPGTYTLFVDPAGNGFFGACGNISVLKDKQTTTPDVEVEYVKPDFMVYTHSHGIAFFENCPFVSEDTNTENSTTVSCKKIGGYEFVLLSLGTRTDFGDYPLLYDGEEYVLQTNGKYEFTVQRSWSDSNTGLKGSLTGTYVVDNSANTTSIGNLTVYRPMDSDNPCVEEGETSTGVIFDTYTDTEPLKYSGNSISYYRTSSNSDFTSFWQEYKDADTDRESNFTRVEHRIYTDSECAVDFSGQYAIYNLRENTITDGIVEKLYFYDDKAEEGNKTQIIDERPETDNNEHYYFTSGSITHNSTDKYIAYLLYKVLVGGNDPSTNIIRFVKLSNPSNKIDIASITDGDYTPNYVRLSLSKDGTPYLLVLLQRSPDHYATVHIYNCSNPSSPSSPIVNYDLDENLSKVSDFRVLEDGSFYVELNDYCFDDYYPENAYYTAMRFRANSNAPIETSKLGTRKSCFMDKYGFMYRFDVTTKSIIKTASLDGEALETYNPNRITEGIMGSTEPVDPEPLNGILGLKEDGSTLYVW